MGVFEDVVIKAKTAADYVGNKTGEIVELSKMKVAAAELEGKIEREYCELGREVYEAAKANTDVTEQIGLKTTAIDALKGELAGIYVKLDDLKGHKKCAACGFVNIDEANYCIKCGEKL
ncbi:MAG TPA: zinc ribbon domain-containing protein [Clostridia bacterium]|nr:zinc ribbon domain-containing protein [Clostridia bacterium]